MELNLDMLCEGYIGAFKEFFYLTGPSSATSKPASKQPTSDELLYIKENLTLAEAATRQGDSQAIHTAYKNIGDFYKQADDNKTASYFYEKCREIAENTEDKDKLLFTYLDLGLSYESQQDYAKSIEYHRQHLDTAKSMGREHDQVVANKNLTRSYQSRALQLQEQKQYERAAEVLNSCVEAAVDAGDLVGEGSANYKMGQIYDMQEDYTKAVGCYKKYLKISLQLEDIEHEGVAYQALGASFRKMGDHVLASKYLEAFHKAAEKSGKMQAQSDACGALGDIFAYQGKSDKAVQYLTQNYDLSGKLKNKETLAESRIKLGIARAEVAMAKFAKLLTSEDHSDVKRLLDWKMHGTEPN